MPNSQSVSSTSRPQSEAGYRRLHWVDTARGLAIVLVVLAHCWRGLESSGLISLDDSWQGHLDRFIYLFHMNAFFVLTGSFLLQQAQRGTGRQFIGHLSRRLLYPLVLWTYVFISLRILAGAAANKPVGGEALLVLPLPPIEHLWFLWAMFLCMVIWGGLARTLPHLHKSPTAWIGLALAASLFWHSVEIPPLLVDWIMETLRHLPFVALGVALGFSARWMQCQMWLPPYMFLWAPAAFIGLEFIAQYADPKSFGLNILSALVTLLFLALSQSITRFWQSGQLMSGIQFLGRHSMAVFLAHTAFSAAMRIVLLKTGISDPNLHLLLGTVVGLLGPVALALFAQRLRVTRLLGF